MVDLLQSLINGVSVGSVYALTAVGLSLVFGVMNIVNFAYGAFVMLAMYVAYFSWSLGGLDPLASLPIGATVLGVVGWLTYRLVIRPVRGRSMQAQIVVTFGLYTGLLGLAQLLWTPDIRWVQDPVASGVRWVINGVVVNGTQVAIAIGAAACTAAIGWFVSRTEAGSAMRAAGEDADGAALMGINVDRMHALSWVLSGVAAGVAGALLVQQYAVDPQAGTTVGLMSFVVVALGGFGSIVGTAAAGLTLGTAQGVVGLYWPTFTTAAAVALCLVVLTIRPAGLRGRS